MIHQAGEEAPHRSFNDWAASPLIVPMHKADRPMVAFVLGTIAVSVAIVVVVAIMVPLNSKSVLNSVWAGMGFVFFAIMFAFVWVLWQRSRGVARAAERCRRRLASGAHPDGSLEHAVSDAMAARSTVYDALSDWRRQDFDLLEQGIGVELPLVWSIGAWESDWLERLLAIPHARVNARVKVDGAHRLWKVFELLAGAALVVFIVGGLLMGVPKWVVVTVAIAVAAIIAGASEWIVQKQGPWMECHGGVLCLCRPDRAGLADQVQIVDPGSLVTIAPVYAPGRFTNRPVADEVQIRFIPPAPGKAFQFSLSRSDPFETLYDEDDDDDPYQDESESAPLTPLTPPPHPAILSPASGR